MSGLRAILTLSTYNEAIICKLKSLIIRAIKFNACTYVRSARLWMVDLCQNLMEIGAAARQPAHAAARVPCATQLPDGAGPQHSIGSTLPCPRHWLCCGRAAPAVDEPDEGKAYLAALPLLLTLSQRRPAAWSRAAEFMRLVCQRRPPSVTLSVTLALLVVANLVPGASQQGGPPSRQQALTEELLGLRVKDLRKRAEDAGVSTGQLDEAMDAEAPKAALIALLLAVPPANARTAASQQGRASRGQRRPAPPLLALADLAPPQRSPSRPRGERPVHPDSARGLAWRNNALIQVQPRFVPTYTAAGFAVVATPDIIQEDLMYILQHERADTERYKR